MKAIILNVLPICLLALAACSQNGAAKHHAPIAMSFDAFTNSAQYRHTRDIWKGSALLQHSPKHTRLEILLQPQRGRLYIHDKIAMDFPLCTGRPGKHETPRGTFKVTQKNKDHRSTLYGAFVDSQSNIVKGGARVTDKRPAGTSFKGAKLPYWIRFNGAIGLHTGMVYRDRASHGCVRVPPEAAPILFDKMGVGSVVLVK